MHRPDWQGPGHQNNAAVPLHPQHRREYHGYHHGPMTPVPGPMYGGYHPAPMYQQQYYAPRWQQQPGPYMQPHWVPPMQPMPQQYAQPRSPMVVTSQPHQPMTPATRPQHAQSPRPAPPYMHHQQQAPLVVASPSPSPAPAQAPPPSAAPRAEPQRVETPPPPSPRREPINPPQGVSEHIEPFWPRLPWYSVPDEAFPARAIPSRRRRQNLHSADAGIVALPTKPGGELAQMVANEEDASAQQESQAASAEEPVSETSTIAAPSEQETPATSQAPSESDFANASTPATPAQTTNNSPKYAPNQQHTRRDTTTKIAVPVVPALPKVPREATSRPTTADQEAETTPKADDGQLAVTEGAAKVEEEKPNPAPAAPPKSWADLVKKNAKPAASSSTNNGSAVANSIPLPKSASLADALKQYDVQRDLQVSFLEPRGLVNTGNMCYMNSVLQVLVFCVPFYSFLDQVRQRTVHSMKSDTPLVDAMIMFVREFKILAKAPSAGALRPMLKQEQLEQYGEPCTPEYVYEVIQRLPRFAGMRRGHQQDAEEFLGFLLEGLHDECVKVMQGQNDTQPQQNGASSPGSVASPTAADDGWLEVGPKQKAAETRTAGQQDAPTPITKIFGGHLRSELRVPGKKDSVTLEPYKPLQLDIGAQNVNNIIDALKGLTIPEAFEGDFGGRGNTAKKQVFVETLPPVLVLHLKRFQYDSSGGTQKIWKKIGYPLDLEIPKEVFAPAKRAGMGDTKPLPKYRLTAVVYHHGKSAAGGHYTVDVLRQDSREWVRMDDTIIRRIRPEDVAEGGSEEDPKLLAKALEQHKNDQELQKQRNMFSGLDDDEKPEEDNRPWSQANGHVKKFSNSAAATVATNGTVTPSTTGKRTPKPVTSVRDNKVAYILLYEKRE
ncbi:putative ubiquitin carboxyl-terminal hydrolase 3 [Fulvia fulva]|nr:putative ubiquitin carboxyl-terminal hydrolase 3 [Fulvia fulva]WPV37929.1 putative ubiquitin carboxyl-terminal hydrolase 3 [Fulvia fulva]